MNNALFYAIALACLAVLVILVFGLASFARGGEFNRKWSNKIMRLRVAAQFVAVVLIVLFVWIFGGAR
jgi:hypothetical protein